jgi:hypothetical protein
VIKVLYARCGNCGQIVPLWCSGQFMPHSPVPAVATPQGAYCSACGILPPIFMCGYCWCRQFLVVQGAQVPATQAIGPGQSVASAVQAPAGASPGMLKDAFAEFLKKAAGEAGSGLGEYLGGSLG